jgi:hypothetical protein
VLPFVAVTPGRKVTSAAGINRAENILRRPPALAFEMEKPNERVTSARDDARSLSASRAATKQKLEAIGRDLANLKSGLAEATSEKGRARPQKTDA